MRSGETRDLPFAQAAELWLDGKKFVVSERTQLGYRVNLRPLIAFLGEIPLRRIHIGNLLEYRRQRFAVAGANCINHELGVLQQILRSAGLWAKIGKHYRQMPRPRHGPGQAPPDEEMRWLFEVAATQWRWRTAYLASLVSANTTAGGGEIVHLRLGDLDFRHRIVHFVKGTKNQRYRVRSMPMNDDCFWALRELDLMAREKGSGLPEHHLFPHRGDPRENEAGRPFDPTRPMVSWQTAWNSLRKAAAQRYPNLLHLRAYDLRHWAATVMGESAQVGEGTAKEIMGHGPGSKLLFDCYFHGRVEAKRRALDTLQGLRKEPASERPAPAAGGTKEYLQ